MTAAFHFIVPTSFEIPFRRYGPRSGFAKDYVSLTIYYNTTALIELGNHIFLPPFSYICILLRKPIAQVSTYISYTRHKLPSFSSCTCAFFPRVLISLRLESRLSPNSLPQSSARVEHFQGGRCLVCITVVKKNRLMGTQKDEPHVIDFEGRFGCRCCPNTSTLPFAV